MAVHIEIDYSKKLGLPGYSSHQLSVSIRTEISTLNDVPKEVERIYQMLQGAVDRQIIHPGYVPGDQPPAQEQNGSSAATNRNGAAWNCSEKQRELILKIVEEQKLDREEVDALAIERFGSGVTRLNKLEASGLIDELLGRSGGGNSRRGRTGGRRAA